MRTGIAVTGVDRGQTGSRLHLADGSLVAAHFVVGADGAHSAVRSSLGITMHGDDSLQESLSVEFRAPLWDIIGPDRYGLYVTLASDPVCVVLPAGGDRWVCGFSLDATTDRLDRYTDGRLTELVRSAAGMPSLDVRIERTHVFAFAALVADRWSVDDVFLVGDAAHRVTPRGGTGMNTAMADGFDLGWRLSVGGAGVGGSGVARRLRARPATPRRAQPPALGGRGRQSALGARRDQRRPGRAPPAPLAGPCRRGFDARSRRSGAHRPHRSGEPGPRRCE